MADDAQVKEGDVWHVGAIGGGGWGDPLDRAPALVCLDVIRDLVSSEAAAREYGVVLAGAHRVDEDATAGLRDRLRTERGRQPMFDRGPGYGDLADGKASADVDWG